MAILEVDGVHNSLGSVVHYNRKGKKVMRLKPANYKDPQSPKQLIHREKMRLASRFTATCKRVIYIGYQDCQSGMETPVNEARSYIMKNCFDTSGVFPVLDYSRILISRGLIVTPEISSVKIEDGYLNVSWKTPVKGDGTNTKDGVMIMLFNTNGDDNYSYSYQDIALRIDGTASIKLPVINNQLYGWMFFHNPNAAISESRKKISDSVYLGNF